MPPFFAEHEADRRILDRLDELKEIFMAAFDELSTATTAIATAVSDVQAHLAAQGTVIDAADAQVLTDAVAGLTASAAALEAIVTPVVAQPPPVV